MGRKYMINADLLIEVLTETKGDRKQAAEILGIARGTLNGYLCLTGVNKQFPGRRGRRLSREAREEAARKRLENFKKKA